jgi:CBS domain containing-hemolysin-like protein
MSNSKTIHTADGTFIVDADMDLEEFDPGSMVDDSRPLSPALTQKDSIVINGETFEGQLKRFSVRKNHVTGVKTVKLVLVSSN